MISDFQLLSVNSESASFKLIRRDGQTQLNRIDLIEIFKLFRELSLFITACDNRDHWNVIENSLASQCAEDPELDCRISDAHPLMKQYRLIGTREILVALKSKCRDVLTYAEDEVTMVGPIEETDIFNSLLTFQEEPSPLENAETRPLTAHTKDIQRAVKGGISILPDDRFSGRQYPKKRKK